MKQSDVFEGMRPAAEFALAKNLTCAQAQRAFLLTLARVALKQTRDVQKEAAELLSVSPGYMSRIVAGKVTPGDPGGRCGRGMTKPLAEGIGEIEL